MALHSEVLPVRASEDVVRVRTAVRKVSLELKFGLVDQTKLVTAASEIARNTLDYVKGGDLHLDVVERAGRRGLRLVFRDQGPGIADVAAAMRDGFTSGKGMGLGLGGTRRLVDDFEIASELNKGTIVTITKWTK